MTVGFEFEIKEYMIVMVGISSGIIPYEADVEV